MLYGISKAGALRWCVNVDVLTGRVLNAPRMLDAVAVLRATMSAGLFAQIVGRGLRMADGKTDCLILDFGGKSQRHGALDADDLRRSKIAGKNGQAAETEKLRECGTENLKTAKRCTHCGVAFCKTCPKCQCDVQLRATSCSECGHMFVREMDNEPHMAAGWTRQAVLCMSLIRNGMTSKRFGGICTKSETPTTNHATMCVIYYLSNDKMPAGDLSWIEVREWVCFEHSGYALDKARMWW
ncbi:MAG UNVERIFIED_CONTAM: hypothetical protein LVR18_50155 [Planctomycetaceae bacterium]